MTTTAEQLAEVQKAISAVMRNQSFSIDGKTVTRANLADLEQREIRLEAKLRKEARGGRGHFSSGRGSYFGG
ncbi:MAG TPA: hypothetical protein DFI00_12840 [Rhodospirillaceae bacterium]|nr:hypothetical protein [Alphaproteobacteria bacterium]OUT41956.1 MAG: hypothetical protein CBB62_06515 [Micavibrio sp. TMED2]HCI48173.1 hypothetical protein [Rhodospirillaceae bacterium]MAS46448.1 hypothetical protein [Alphaproteobacteria bacterium]MAX94543.1 hypothetical protein [Alphaproteobacteria bacterium]|tara:strand:- start:15515 stop:15730 length:216 start_codon:yes stop_codon:yes gene_type:complete